MNSERLLGVLRYFANLHEWENVRPYIFDGERTDKQLIMTTQVLEVGYQLTRYPEAYPLIIIARSAIIPDNSDIYSRRSQWITGRTTNPILRASQRELMYGDIEIQLMAEGIGTFYKIARNGNHEGSLHYCPFQDKYPSL